MRHLLFACFCFAASSASAADDVMAEIARGEAVATVEAIVDPAARADIALYVADAMILAGRCTAALPLIRRYGRERVDPRRLLALFHAVTPTRDSDCIAAVARALAGAARDPRYPEADRTRFGFLAAVLFRLGGRADRADAVEPEDLAAVDFVASDRQSTTLELDRLNILVNFADPPTERQVMIIAALRAYEGTAFHVPMLEALAERAEAEPSYLNREGWTDIAVLLAQAGREAIALEMLDRNRARALTPAGLRAELALRAGRHEEAAALLSEPGQYYLRDEQRRAIVTASPLSLKTYISRPSYWDDNPLELADYSEALDAAGHRVEGERAARAAVAMFVGSYDDWRFCNRRARLLARLRRFDEAELCVRRVFARDPGEAILVAGRLLQGLAAIDEERRIDDLLNGYDDDRRREILRRALSEGCRFSPAIQLRLAQEWVRLRRGADEGLIRAAAEGGCSADALQQLAGEGSEGMRLLYNAAHIARLRHNHVLAGQLAARIPFNDDTVDVVFGGLSRIHWVTGNSPQALLMARRVRDPTLRAKVLIDGWMDVRLQP